MNINKFYSDVAKKVIPYKWEEFDMEKPLRFDANTSPTPPPSVGLFLKKMEEDCPINEYADPSYSRLKKLLADYEKVDISLITITNSGDEAIDILGKTFLNNGDYYLITPPTYEVYNSQLILNKGECLEVPLAQETWEVDANKIISESKNKKVKIIFLCNPNNPTGSIIPQKMIEKILNNAEGIVVVDETYREFYGKSSISLLKKYSNLVILRSFSKFASLAGARIGYLLASKELSEKFDAIRFPMGVSFLSYKLAEFVLEKDKKWINNQVKNIKEERKRLNKELLKFGFKIYPSYANFLLIKVGDIAKELSLKLKLKGIVVRDRSSKKYLDGCIRITVRSKKENDQLLKILKAILGKTESKKYAFLDRDGTLIFEPQDTFQIDSVEKLKILDGVIKGLKNLTNIGYELIMISNQDGLGTPSLPKDDFEAPQNKMLNIFEENGIKFRKIFICPHFPEDNCNCRKPKTGLVEKFLYGNQMDKDKSFVCGDRRTDRLFAKKIGIKFIPMRTNGNFCNALTREGVIV